MAVTESVFAPSLLTRLAAPLRRMQRTAIRRRGPLDVALEDFLFEAVKPGDKVLQLGASDNVAACFLNRGAFQILVAPASSAEAVEANCQLRGCSASRLRVFESVGASGQAGRVDAVWITPAPTLAIMAAHFRHADSRLRAGGTLYLAGIDTPHGKSVFNLMNKDNVWRLDEVISGQVAVFRKTTDLRG